MGQQQLLLIILGVIVVGIAVAVGITMFNDSATSANRDAVTNDLINLASRAQQYYRRPTALGGGGGSFAGLSGNIKLLTKTSGTAMVSNRILETKMGALNLSAITMESLGRASISITRPFFSR